MKTRVRQFWIFLQRENLHRLLILLAIMIVLSSLLITFLEPDVSLINGLWWSVVTLTTVGYGDISPTSIGGRMVAVIIMFFGIGLLGMLSATIASVLVAHKVKEDRGLSRFTYKNHIIICEWNHRARAVLHELRSDPKTADTPVVLIADIEHNPLEDENLHFIRGSVDDETLSRANLTDAQTVVILGEDTLAPSARDAKAVLATLTVESINPNVYTIVELVSEANVRHCKRASADEIIVSSGLSSGLIARAALDHGITKIFAELLSIDSGDELYKVAISPSMIGKHFIEVLTELKANHGSIAIGIQRGTAGNILSNPPADLPLEADDQLILVAAEPSKSTGIVP